MKRLKRSLLKGSLLMGSVAMGSAIILFLSPFSCSGLYSIVNREPECRLLIKKGFPAKNNRQEMSIPILQVY